MMATKGNEDSAFKTKNLILMNTHINEHNLPE